MQRQTQRCALGPGILAAAAAAAAAFHEYLQNLHAKMMPNQELKPSFLVYAAERGSCRAISRASTQQQVSSRNCGVIGVFKRRATTCFMILFKGSDSGSESSASNFPNVDVTGCLSAQERTTNRANPCALASSLPRYRAGWVAQQAACTGGTLVPCSRAATHQPA